MNYIILQLPVAHPGTFRSYEENEEYNRLPKREDYVCVYIGQIDGINGEATLNRIYEKLNINHPTDYHARSLSVSDVIGLEVGEKQLEWWYVDSFGFKKIWRE